MRWECWERLPRHRGSAIPVCITARAWLLSDMGFLSDSGHVRAVMHAGKANFRFLLSQSQGKRSRHSRRMRNPQFYVFVKKPMSFKITSLRPGNHALSTNSVGYGQIRHLNMSRFKIYQE